MGKVIFDKSEYVAPPTQEYVAPPVEKEKPYGDKNRYTAGILAVLLGVFGVHNFYLGYTKKAIIQLILGLSVVFVYVSVIWGIYEGILLFTDKLNVDGKGKIIL